MDSPLTLTKTKLHSHGTGRPQLNFILPIKMSFEENGKCCVNFDLTPTYKKYNI